MKPQSKKPVLGRLPKSGDKKLVGENKSQLKTGWGNVADWYHDVVEEKGSYQKDLILPNLLRLMDVKKGEAILDLACGEGFFSRRLARLGARVIGVDISRELIEIAQQDTEGADVQYEVAPADKIPFIENETVDKAVIVLALQNIENAHGALAECSRVLKEGGKLYIVLNHPAFRIPKQSSWGYDEKTNTQYRRVDRYLSELREKIQMHPGERPDEMTVSFHRPFQYYFKAFKKAGLAVVNMEEWSSGKKSQPGPRAEAENRSRAEFPLFMVFELIKL